MPDFEILWAPLSRKWQVWQRQADESGCAVETLIGEYSSEGRANHEVAVLCGDLPSDAIYEAPHYRHWFSPLRLLGKSVSAKTASATAEGDPGDAQIPIELLDSSQSTTAERGVGRSNTESESTEVATEWRASLISRLELVRRHAERDEVESVRRYLREALHVIPEEIHAAVESDRAA